MLFSKKEDSHIVEWLLWKEKRNSGPDDKIFSVSYRSLNLKLLLSSSFSCWEKVNIILTYFHFLELFVIYLFK